MSTPKLLPQVRRTIKELNLGDEHAGMIRLAETLAATIDGMEDDVRERMLGQTAGQLARTLDALAERARGPRRAAPLPPGEETTVSRLRRQHGRRPDPRHRPAREANPGA